MKIAQLKDIKASHFASDFTSMLYELSTDEFIDLMLPIINELSDDAVTEMAFAVGYDYEVGAIFDDCSTYTWLDEPIEFADNESDAMSIAENAINSNEWAGYTIVILKTPKNMTIQDRMDASSFEVYRYYIPEEEE